MRVYVHLSLALRPLLFLSLFMFVCVCMRMCVRVCSPGYIGSLLPINQTRKDIIIRTGIKTTDEK